MKQKLAKQSESIHEEKKKRRADTAAQVQKRKAVEATVEDLYEWIDELHNELSQAKADVKQAEKKAKEESHRVNKIKTVASKRLELLRDLKIKLRETKDDLAVESHHNEKL